MKPSILLLLFLFPLTVYAQVDCTDEVSISLTPEVPDNIYCPGDQVLLKTNEGYSNYQWYYNFSNSNMGGTPIGGATFHEYVVDINTWGFAYFYAEMSNDTCEYVTDPVIVDSYAFLFPVIASSGQSDYCQGDSTAIYYPAPGGAFFQWYKDGQPIPGAVDSVYYVTETGTYVLEMSYEPCPNYWLSSGVGPSFTFHDTLEVSIGINGDQLAALAVGGDPTVIQWYLDGQPIAGGNELLQDYVGPGNYQVRITSDAGCNSWSETVYLNISSSSEPEKKDLHIYPNPASDVLVVSAGEEISRIDLFTVDGVLTESQQYQSTSCILPIQSLPAGIFLAKVTFERGETIWQRILVTR